MLSFPSNFTEEHALAVIATLEQLPAVEKVVAASASNLEFQPADFTREYGANQTIPEIARRGLDRDELSPPAMTQAQISEAAQMPHVPRQMIVRWKSQHVWKANSSGFLKKVADFHASAGAHVIKEMRPSPTDLTQVIEFGDPGISLASKLREYLDCPWIEDAQPNYVYQAASVSPNDPFYTNLGQPNLPKISGPDAWDPAIGGSQGDHQWVVAVADTGANVVHSDLVENVSAGGHNFIADNSNVDDDDTSDPYHGSKVAGILGAKGNNSKHMTGVSWNLSLLILKVLDENGSGTTDGLVSAIDYAYSTEGHDPAIALNLSLAIPQPMSFLDPAMVRAIRRARENNMVVVAAAGNNHLDCDQAGNLISPANIPTDNIITVGGTWVGGTVDDHLWSLSQVFGSNYGRYRVELGAPADNIVSAGILSILQDPRFQNGDLAYGYLKATSAATPHVTGAIQLVKSKYPWEDYQGIRDRVLMGTDDVPSLSNLFRTGGRLNLYKALQKRTLIRNFSTRAKVESGDRIVIGGFIVSGNSVTGPASTLKVAIRGLGPSLPTLSVPRLNDPKIILNNSAGKPIFINNDWGSLPQSQKDDLAAAGLTPTSSAEAAMVRQLTAGSYTVLLQSQDGQQGVGQFEIYELSGNTNEQTRLRNLSTRCPIGTGDEVAIAGTILGDASSVPKRRLLMRGIGPSLAALGLLGVLPDPEIELHASTGTLIDSNNQWRDVDGSSTGLEDKLTESAFAPTNDNESVLWPTLGHGAYTATLQSADTGTGIGLFEVFEN